MKAKIIFIAVLAILRYDKVRSQSILFRINQNIYMDVAKNILNEKAVFRCGSVSTLGFRDLFLQAGIAGSYPDHNSLRIKGWFINLGSNFRIKKVPFECMAFYRVNPFSKIIHETNWGIILGYNSKHFCIRLGNNYRIYKIQKNALEYKMQDGADTRIIEPRNIMYSITWSIKPVGHKWNLSLTLTNFDHFLVQQETNPMSALEFSHRINEKLRIYTEVWYQNAGMLNLQVNYFGFNVRTGLTWQIFR